MTAGAPENNAPSPRRPSLHDVRWQISAIPAGIGRRIRGLLGRPIAVAIGVAVLILALVGTTVAYVSINAVYATPTPEPSEIAAATETPTPEPTATPTPTPSPTPTPTPLITPSPTPQMVAATTDGILLPADQASIATRQPVAVMIDDHWGARPQSGLSLADIVYQGPAEGGIPRYMAIFQTHDAPEVGPVRSSRLYFVVWAEEYHAAYAHMWGAPNAMARLATDNGRYITNIDGLRYGGKSGYMWRVAFRVGPHNLYTSSMKLMSLASRLSGPGKLTKSPFLFGDALPASQRPIGSRIVVTYNANKITYLYDHATNTYVRSVSIQTSTGGSVQQIDASNEQRIAPTNVVLMYMNIGLLACSGHVCMKHRLDVQYLGHGRAMVFKDGRAINAVWTRRGEHTNTVLTYADGPNKGQQVVLNRGQIFVNVISTGYNTTASWSTGYLPPVETEPLAS
jgi:hypothetical protein